MNKCLCSLTTKQIVIIYNLVLYSLKTFLIWHQMIQYVGENLDTTWKQAPWTTQRSRFSSRKITDKIVFKFKTHIFTDITMITITQSWDWQRASKKLWEVRNYYIKYYVQRKTKILKPILVDNMLLYKCSSWFLRRIILMCNTFKQREYTHYITTVPFQIPTNRPFQRKKIKIVFFSNKLFFFF